MLNLKKIHKSYNGKKVLNGISFALNNDDTMAVIGANGSGKTTLLKIIAGKLTPDAGEITNTNVIVAYVPQENNSNETIYNFFAKSTPLWQVKKTLSIVDLKKSVHHAVSTLSGGQKTKLSLAKALAHYPQPNVLIFDEPTNNLDSEMLQWLENFIKNFNGAVLVASHNRHFINQIATSVVEIDNGKIKHYGGNYDFYKQQKELELQSQADSYKQNIDEKKRLLKLHTEKFNLMQQTKSVTFDKLKHESRGGFNYHKNAAQKGLGKQISSIESRINQLEDIQKPEQIKNYKVSIDGSTHNSKLIIKVEKVSKSFGKNIIFKDVSFSIVGNQKIHIVGPNGSGKTTLLNIVAGRIRPETGNVQTGSNIEFGYFSQDVYGLDNLSNGYENLSVVSTSRTHIYRSARSMGLTEQDLQKKPDQLSRGQQAKLGFTKLLLQNYQLLILDEPTNHLDIRTKELIETALKNYNGAILLASHDEYFVEAIGVDSVFELD